MRKQAFNCCFRSKNTRKQAFTVVELLMAFFLMSFIVIIAISLMSTISTTLFNGQTESKNRASLNDNIFFLTREIQSAEQILITDKTLKIKQFGVDHFSIEYTITDGKPFGSLNLKDKKMLDLEYSQSRFSANGNVVKIELALVKNNLDFRQIPKIISFDVTVRSEGVLIN